MIKTCLMISLLSFLAGASAFGSLRSEVSSGRAIALNYLVVPKTGFEGLAIELKIEGVDMAPAQMLVDVGSSSMSFCPGFLPDDLPDAWRTDYNQCNEYGMAQVDLPPSCPPLSDGNVYSAEFYSGDVYQSPVVACNASSIADAFTMPEAYYTVMEYQSGMTCDGGFRGIFGVAFKSGNTAALSGPSGKPTFQHCTDPKSKAENGEIGACLETMTHPLPSALHEELAQVDEQRFGIYVNFSIPVTGSLTYDRGMLYTGPMAIENAIYRSGESALITQTYPRVYQLPTEGSHWSFAVNEVYVGNKVVPRPVPSPANGLGTSWCPLGGSCFVDSGRDNIVLPFQVCEAIGEADASADINLSIMAGVGIVQNLTIPVEALIVLKDYWETACSYPTKGQSDLFVLGLPVWSLFYIKFDDILDTIEFVRLP